MCRVHEQDAFGMILTEELGYEYLVLPMDFKPERIDEVVTEEDLTV